MEIISIVGARPQFIKSAPVSVALAEAGIHEYKIHTGQHYDYEMSQVFFEDLDLPEPSINLGIGSGTHAKQTGEMLIGIEKELMKQKPDFVIVYGDTNSTLAGALAAVKLNVKVAHIEAGLRSYNRLMPEEHNRVLTDHCSDLLFCPTQTSIKNLRQEGIDKGVHLVGDTMYDAVLKYGNVASKKSKILSRLNIAPKKYLLATIHRAYNTDNMERLSSLLDAFKHTGENIIFPAHPRTLQAIRSSQLDIPDNVNVIDPVGYMDSLMLEQNARIIMTDSGGMQKEAYFFQVPCLTLRPETEWVETVKSGWNKLVDTDSERISEAVRHNTWNKLPQNQIFGNGKASQNIVSILEGNLH